MSAINFPIATTSLFVNTLTTNKIIYLPAASTVNAGRLFYIKDICGNAANSSIYISTTGLDRIENNYQPSTAYAFMSTNYGSVLMAPDGALNWYFLQHFCKSSAVRFTGGVTIFSTFSFSQTVTTSSQQVSISGVTSLSGWIFVSATMGGGAVNNAPRTATMVPSATIGLWYCWCRDGQYTKVVRLQYTLTSGNLYVVGLDEAYTSDLTVLSTSNTPAQNDTQYAGSGFSYGTYGPYNSASHSFQVPVQ